MSLPHALLGLLAHGPKSGYDLKREFDRSVAHTWNANTSQIYPTLRQLEEQGFVTGELAADSSRPTKTNYSLTPAGREELERWLQAPPAPRHRKDPFLLRVFFLDLLSPTEQHQQLVRFVAEQDRFLAMCDRYRSNDDGTSTWPLASMEIAVASARAKREWVEDKLRELAEQSPEVAALERARKAAAAI